MPQNEEPGQRALARLTKKTSAFTADDEPENYSPFIFRQGAGAPEQQRTVFTTSRLPEFSTVPEPSKLVGVAPDSWASVIVKECVDNALDAADGVAPIICIEVSTWKGTISIEDNGPGIKPATVTKLLDYRTKSSSREAYVGVSRGAQGNALQSWLAMPFALDGANGETTIEAHRTAHDLKARVQAFLRDHPEARWDAAVEAVLREAPTDGKSTPTRKQGGRS